MCLAFQHKKKASESRLIRIVNCDTSPFEKGDTHTHTHFRNDLCSTFERSSKRLANTRVAQNPTTVLNSLFKLRIRLCIAVFLRERSKWLLFGAYLPCSGEPKALRSFALQLSGKGFKNRVLFRPRAVLSAARGSPRASRAWARPDDGYIS